MKMPKINSLTIILLVLVSVVYIQLELPQDPKEIIDKELVKDEYGKFPAVLFDVLAGETVFIFAQGKNFSITIYQNKIGNLLIASNSSEDVEFEKYHQSSSRMGVSISTVGSEPVYLKIYTTGSQKMFGYSLIVPSLILILAIGIELLRRKYHPPYFEDEVRAISPAIAVIPAGLLYAMISTNYTNTSFDLGPTKYYDFDLNMYLLVLNIIDYYTPILFLTLILVPASRIVNVKKLHTYRSLNINKNNQFITRVAVWSTIHLAFLHLLYFDMFFSRGSEFLSFDYFIPVYLGAILLISLIVINLVILEVIIIDITQSYGFMAFFVPFVYSFVFSGVLPTFPPFDYIWPTNPEIISRIEHSDLRIIMFLRVVLTSVVLFWLGLMNRRRKWFRTGT